MIVLEGHPALSQQLRRLFDQVVKINQPLRMLGRDIAGSIGFSDK